jgi:hypothetical protein
MSSVSLTEQAFLANGVREPQGASVPDVTVVPPDRVTRALYVVGGFTGLLALIGLIGATQTEQQFAFSYLTSYAFAVSIAIGSLFWVFLHHLTSATWSVVVRRLYENLTVCLPVLALLFLPIALSLNALYGWMDVDANASDPVWQEKRAFLNGPWFFVRALVYLVCWTGLAWRMRNLSLRQDRSGDPALTGQMVFTSAWGMVVLALTSTYAAFDWLMSLDYRWYSTMYGVYFWAGSIVGSLAALTLTVVILHAAGWLRRTITEEHLHDLGKLLFAFVIFWAYIAFSQYFLIWYANLTDEIPWYVQRLQGESDWRWVTIALMIGHFVVPFAVLLSRHAKRSWVVLGFVSVWILAFHYVDLYWQVMPVLHPAQALPHWLDIAWLLVFVGVVMLGVLYGLRTSALVPVRDPRLPLSLRFHQE